MTIARRLLPLLATLATLATVSACGGADDTATAQSGTDALSGTPSGGVAVADLPTFPRIDLSINREVNLNRDFVLPESDGMLQFIGDPHSVADEKTGTVGPETMVVKLAINGDPTPPSFSVELKDGKTQAEVLSEFAASLKKGGFESQVVFEGTFNQFGVDRPWKKLSIFKPGKASRPVPGRDDLGRLDVVFKTVALEERLGTNGALNAGPTNVSEDGTTGPLHNDEFAALSPNLKNFISLGEDGLTHHEAQTLGFGLGIIHEPGESGATFRAGDRVVIEVPGNGTTLTTRGIVVSANANPGKADTLEILAVDPRTADHPYVDFGLEQVKVTRLLAGGFVDGR